MTALALELCCTIMVDRKSIQNVGLAVRNKVLPQALVLIRSSLLQGQAFQVSLFSQDLALEFLFSSG
jgi:cullin-associated NEDD8-dissociated protein 1